MRTEPKFKCSKCYGKGYASIYYGWHGHGDFIGDPDYLDPVRPRMKFCSCDRGRALEDIINENYTKKTTGGFIRNKI